MACPASDVRIRLLDGRLLRQHEALFDACTIEQMDSSVGIHFDDDVAPRDRVAFADQINLPVT